VLGSGKTTVERDLTGPNGPPDDEVEVKPEELFGQE
jgi:hypothetical protein